MKVQCDVCENSPATVICCADEAALCQDCDTRVHAANKLASKHQRVPLVFPAAEESPSCDVCEEKTGYFFCMEDRALLCRNCDFFIHSKTCLASRHKRFLVTGVRVALQAGMGQELNQKKELRASSPSQSVSSACQMSSCHQVSPCVEMVEDLSLSKILNHHPSGEVVDDFGLSKRLNHHAAKTAAQSMKISPVDASALFMLQSNNSEGSNSQALRSLTCQHTYLPAGKITRVQEKSEGQKLSFADEHAGTTNSPQLSAMKAASGSMVPFSNGLILSPCRPPSAVPSAAHTVPYSERILSSKGIGPSMMEMSSQNMVDVSWKGSINIGGGGGAVIGRNTISEYLTETIPGWRVDDLLGFPDTATDYNFEVTNTSKLDTSSLSDMEWPAECGIEDQILGESLGQVPSVPSPPTATGVPRAVGRCWGFGKSQRQLELSPLLVGGCDDALLVVPDTGSMFSPPSHSPTSLPCKRKRSILDAW